MADWVHCNKCISQPCPNGPRFHITNCGHIYCEACVESATLNKCLVCAKRCNAILLSTPLKSPIDSFFTDPMELRKTQVAQLQQVSDFQKNHRLRLFTSLKDKVQKCTDEIRRLVGRVNDLEKENTSLKQELAQTRCHPSGGTLGAGDHHGIAFLPGSVPNYYQPRPQPMAISPLSAKKTASPGMIGTTNISHLTPRAKSAPTTPVNRHDYVTNSPQLTPTKTLIGASRLSVRGPPSDGKLGPVSPTSGKQETPIAAIPSGVRASRVSPSSQHQHQTTLERMATSPIHTSPSSHRRHGTTSPECPLPRSDKELKKTDDRYFVRRKPWMKI